MNIVNPSVEFVYPPSYETVLMTFNTAARNCYKSATDNNNNMEDAEKLARRLIAVGHGSPIEMNNITVKIVADRSYMGQITRQRLSSFAIESMRYVNYSKDKFNHSVGFVIPQGMLTENGSCDKDKFDLWFDACSQSEKSYFKLIELGCKPEEARSVLPQCTATTIVMGANIREWRHIFELRCDSHAQLDIRRSMTTLLKMMYERYPVFFEDLYKKFVSKENVRSEV